MRHTNMPLRLAAVLCILLSYITSYAITNDNCESPYFQVVTDDDKAALFPLKSTEVAVDISGVIADVTVKQIYTNSGEHTIEAIYVFPASTRAAVYAMQMKIGERTITAEVKEREQARKDYEAAKEEGKTASLLEEERPNVFKMNVANIVAGATVEVEMSYTELLIPTNKVYEFVYPTVVGPRYTNPASQKEKNNEKWTKNPYLEEHEMSPSTLDINIHLNTSIPIQEVRCDTHKNTINYQDDAHAEIKLSERDGNNRDFVMQYRLAGDEIETGIMLYDNPEGEKFFLAMMQPPMHSTAESIPPREYVFIVDVSGSMHGFPLDVSKSLLESLLGELKESDRFNIIFFAGGSYIYSDKSLAANDDNIAQAINFINQHSGSGGTELMCALQSAMQLNNNDDYARSFVIITDGYVKIETETFDYIRNNLGNANFFSFGIGSSVNRYLIEGMAHVGYGEPFIALNNADAKKKAALFKTYISHPVMTNISYEFEGFEAYDILPEAVPDLFAERPIIISGKYRGEAHGTLKIKGTTGNSTITKSLKIGAKKEKNEALKYLWAREKIRLLGDYNNLGKDHWSSISDQKEQLKTEITQLGLAYNLLTPYTSFIAIDSETNQTNGDIETVTQPLPLPQGVSGVSSQAMMVRGMSRAQANYRYSPKYNKGKSTKKYKRKAQSELEVLSFEEEEENDDNKVFMVVERMPEFPGGTNALKSFLSQHVNYPKAAAEKGISGRVYVEFVVDTTGQLTQIKILKGVHPLLDAEALRVVNMMPRWSPGSQRGKAVNVRYRLPINFSTTPQTAVPTSTTPAKSNTEVQPGYQTNYLRVPPC